MTHQIYIRPQCLFSSVVSTYRYNTVCFCKTKKKVTMLQSSVLTECQSFHQAHIEQVLLPMVGTLKVSNICEYTFIYIYIYIYIDISYLSYTNKQLDSMVRSLVEIKSKTKRQEVKEIEEQCDEERECGQRKVWWWREYCDSLGCCVCSSVSSECRKEGRRGRAERNFQEGTSRSTGAVPVCLLMERPREREGLERLTRVWPRANAQRHIYSPLHYTSSCVCMCVYVWVCVYVCVYVCVCVSMCVYVCVLKTREKAVWWMCNMKLNAIKLNKNKIKNNLQKAYMLYDFKLFLSPDHNSFSRPIPGYQRKVLLFFNRSYV